ncbi:MULTISPECIES: hypothetical protein [unclassified Streptomyces]|uniref:hypothetical protein n=1 Tax=unclassified Streptomyces TaxID=2593676 RepID=UPI0023665E1E|nr:MULTISPECIES: hypothetical protein [unclassified Streptomyces]MDF3146162.1 hypothetical protein [Streptomyces sp. T21Q-yed]WDF36605.1 hypothetical protein PBV52_07400 [Streptomyces sp. T12]
MGTAERREAPEGGTVAHVSARRGPEALDHDIPADGRQAMGSRDAPVAAGAVTTDRHDVSAGSGRKAAADKSVARAAGGRAAQEWSGYRPLWVEEPARRRRMPDPVRTASVRAVLIIAVTLIQAMVAFLCTLAGSWLAFPMVISSVVSTVVATWGALDVWVTRQVWNQRNGVVSTPSSTARILRRERRRARRQTREAERAQERIRRRGGAGQLSHS